MDALAVLVDAAAESLTHLSEEAAEAVARGDGERQLALQWRARQVVAQ